MGRGRGTRGVRGTLFIFFFITIIIGEHMKMLCFKFHQNHPINEFDFFEGRGRGGEGPPRGNGNLIRKFMSQFEKKQNVVFQI